MSDFLEGKLDNQEIRKKLSERKYTSGFKPAKELVDSIIDQFWFHDYYNSFISDEVYLKYLLKYLDQKRPEVFNRYDFYDFFFNEVSPAKGRRVMLQGLALKFEQFQTDRITYTKFTKLLRSINLSTLASPLF